MIEQEGFAYWAQLPSAQHGAITSSLKIETINEIEPLAAQFGADAPQTIPNILYDQLFGPLNLRTYSNDEPLQTYAVLDAAKATNLPELLATSGLEHRCLFKGEAYDTLKDVAPWIVRLEENNTFTCSLFSHSNGPWHLWDKELGIYLRSQATLDQLWGQLRKFTKLQDYQKRWVYLRFWTDVFWMTIIQDQALHENVIPKMFFNQVERLIHRSSKTNKWYILQGTVLSPQAPHLLVIDEKLRSALAEEVTRRQEDSELSHLIAETAESSCTYNYEALVRLRNWLINAGFTQTDHRTGILKQLLAKGFLRGAPWPSSLRNMLADPARGAGVRLWLLENKEWQ